MHLIQILLPLHDNEQQEFPSEYFQSVRKQLAQKFGGVTAYTRSPAEGLWQEETSVSRDQVVLFEVLAEDLDQAWWDGYRQQLEHQFRQDEVLIWASSVMRL